MRSYTPQEYDCFEWPKQCKPDDFKSQVKRTVNGEPISADQNDLILKSISDNLDLNKDDILLDLCCGNGYLTYPFSSIIKNYVGVDYSDTLISIAKNNFLIKDKHIFYVDKAGEFLLNYSDVSRFTKVLCYGAFSYFSSNEASTVLSSIYDKYINVMRMFIGPIPDIDKIDQFFIKGKNGSNPDDHTSSIGKWYSREEILRLASSYGWKAEIIEKDPKSYQAHYRFDVLLSR